MVAQLDENERLIQVEAVAAIEKLFGSEFVYLSAIGEKSINTRVLYQFRKLTGDEVVWVTRQGGGFWLEAYWRKRVSGDSPGRTQYVNGGASQNALVEILLDPSTHPSADPIALAVIDSFPEAEPQPNEIAIRHRARLPFDIGLVDPQTAAFLVVFTAGTPLDALKPRTVSLPAGESESPITVLALHARTPSESQPVPYLTLQCPLDIRGRQLTLRFTDPADLRSLAVAWNPIQGMASPVKNGSV